LSTAPPHSLIPVCSLFLTGCEVLSWVSASVSAPNKSHPRFVSRKTSYLSWLFFLSRNISRFPDTTDYTALNRILFVNNNHDQTSYSYLDRYSKSGPNFSGENGPGRPFFLEFWSPRPIFFAGPKFPWQFIL